MRIGGDAEKLLLVRFTHREAQGEFLGSDSVDVTGDPEAVGVKGVGSRVRVGSIRFFGLRLLGLLVVRFVNHGGSPH